MSGMVFDHISQVLPAVRSLAQGHRTLRQWSLGQICLHLANGFHGSIDGLDLGRHRIKRTLFRRALIFYTLRWGIPEQYTVDPGIEPQEPVNVELGIDALRRAIERYVAHTGPLQAHPLFGKMSRRTWDRIHRIHCAHHLNFVVMANHQGKVGSSDS